MATIIAATKMETRYGVQLQGKCIASNTTHKIQECSSREEAMAKRKRMNKILSPGEKKYYKMKYTIVKITTEGKS